MILADINTVTVNVSGQGDYEYSIDEPTGPFQIQISLETYLQVYTEVYINDKIVCGTVSKIDCYLRSSKVLYTQRNGFDDVERKRANTV
jgi:hypothetical protein